MLETLSLEVAGFRSPGSVRSRKLCVVDVAGDDALVPQTTKYRERHQAKSPATKDRDPFHWIDGLQFLDGAVRSQSRTCKRRGLVRA